MSLAPLEEGDLPLPIESAPPEEPPSHKKKKSKEVTFARPVFAHELMSEEGKKRFDDLPSWQRHLIKRLIDHGDLSRAAQEAGVSTYVKKTIDPELAQQTSVVEALNKGGVTPDFLVHHLMDCIEAKCVKFDKHQNPLHVVDMDLKLRALEVAFKLRGDFIPKRLEGPAPPILDLFKDTPVEPNE